MKRILSFAASAAMLLGFMSCEQQPVPGETPWLGDGNFLKTITLSLAGADTRATSAADEFSIGEATVFVYQSGPSGETLYKIVQTESSTVGVDLLFTDAVDYTYRFEAYANMGELTEAPSEVSFEDESLDGFQMHGSLSGVDASSAGSATVMLDRYVGRVVVGSVKLQWKDQANASQEFTLKRMWLANAAALSGGEAAYNVGGAYVASAMDALLVSEVNQVIADGGTYDVPHYLYAYASGSTALVLECEWAGQTMYYHVDYEPVANSSMTYTLSIHQTGSSEPLGDVTDDALVAAGALQANDWNSQESEKHFGEKPGIFSTVPVGASIYHVDGSFYTADAWTEAETEGVVNESDAVGVAVSDGVHSFVINSTTKSGLSWSTNTEVIVEGVFTPEGMTDEEKKASALNDFAGEANTAAILAAVSAGTIADARAASYCDGVTFAHGKKGYLPAAGEVALIVSNGEDVNSCFKAMDGTAFMYYTTRIWTSTQRSAVLAWIWKKDDGTNSGGSISSYSKDHTGTPFVDVMVVSSL